MTAVSVIIPSFNYAEYVGRAIESVLAQTVPAAEVIVVDDGSTDDSVAVVRSFGPRVRLVEQENAGVAAARNHGAAVSSSPMLAFLDADDYWHPRKLELEIARYEQEPSVGLVHCGVERVTPDGKVLERETTGGEGWVAEELLLLRKPVVLGGGSGLLIPSEAFRAVGGFDERMSTAADWDFCLRVALKFPIAFVPTVLVAYTAHARNMHYNLPAMEHDVLLGFDKVFTSHAERLGRLRSDALSNLFMTLSGSYFTAGDVRRAVVYGARSIRYQPSQALYALQFPARRWRRRVSVG